MFCERSSFLFNVLLLQRIFEMTSNAKKGQPPLISNVGECLSVFDSVELQEDFEKDFRE